MNETAKRVIAAHDGLLTICTGSGRRSKSWKAKRIAWSQLIQKLSQTKRTAETQREYLAMDKASQNAVKDVGGFVGGELRDGRRTALSVMSRQIVTLDADFADASIWDMVETGVAIGGCAACCYSTHTHSPEKPRLRLVIPLDRPASPDEYQAIARKIAEGFGIDHFDDTTYQPHRLMYWPSTSIDGEYFFRWQDGPWLGADSVLEEYDDWQDQSSWPVSSRVAVQVQREMKKQQDPTEKKGLVGTFCRVYDIEAAMEKFLPGVYEPCGDGRYTFSAGSSFGGAVAYDEGKWLYSWHATDPCSCQLVNAFDLVRIHKFVDLDEGKAATDVTKLPSYARMMELVESDEAVRIQQTKERMAEARGEFDDLGDEEGDDEWMAKLKMDSKGRILPTRANIRAILENDPRIKGTFGWDAFSMRIAILRKPGWRSEDSASEYWEDGDDAELRYFIETCYGIDSRMRLDDEVLSCAMRHRFHPVRDYLESIEWDGKERMETLFIDYLGAEDSKYTRMATRKMLIAAVGRVMSPGLKFDSMVVLQGRQGIGKSMLLKELGGKWFSDSLDAMSGKEAYEQLRNVWIVEVGELAALRAGEIEATKKFISKQTDTYRVPYGRRTQDFPRQCIFVGTTNEMSFLKDRTGNRRFWPIRVGVTEPAVHPWDADFRTVAGQVWAEALHYWRAGEDVWLGSVMEQEAESQQKRHLEENPLQGLVEEYLEKEVPANWYKLTIRDRQDFIKGTLEVDMTGAFRRERICTAEIWCELLGGSLKNFRYSDRRSLNEIMRSMDGWKLYDGNKYQMLRHREYGNQRTYVRKKAEDGTACEQKKNL